MDIVIKQEFWATCKDFQPAKLTWILFRELNSSNTLGMFSLKLAMNAFFF